MWRERIVTLFCQGKHLISCLIYSRCVQVEAHTHTHTQSESTNTQASVHQTTVVSRTPGSEKQEAFQKIPKPKSVEIINSTRILLFHSRIHYCVISVAFCDETNSMTSHILAWHAAHCPSNHIRDLV